MTPDLFTLNGLFACQFDIETLRVLRCSSALARASGYQSGNDLKDLCFLDLFSSSSISALQDKVQQGRGGSLQVRLGGPAEQPVFATFLESNENAERTTLVICIPCEDFQSQNEVMEANLALLESRTERLTDFTSLVVHDLRNALHLVTANIDLLSLDLKPVVETDVARRLEKMRNAGVNMAVLLDGISKYLRFEVGDYPMELTNLNTLVDEVAKNASEHPSKAVTIKRTDSLPSVICERQLVQELFQNLIGNAIKYTDKSNVEIEIGLSSMDQDQPVFYVKDNGVGIEENDLARIFKPFSRADRQNLNRHGSGMGMTLVKKIVERHGGDIWLKSEPNIGTTVSFSIGTKGVV